MCKLRSAWNRFGKKRRITAKCSVSACDLRAPSNQPEQRLTSFAPTLYVSRQLPTVDKHDSMGW